MTAGQRQPAPHRGLLLHHRCAVADGHPVGPGQSPAAVHLCCHVSPPEPSTLPSAMLRHQAPHLGVYCRAPVDCARSVTASGISIWQGTYVSLHMHAACGRACMHATAWSIMPLLPRLARAAACWQSMGQATWLQQPSRTGSDCRDCRGSWNTAGPSALTCLNPIVRATQEGRGRPPPCPQDSHCRARCSTAATASQAQAHCPAL